jgi:hypothetical protein
VQFGSFRPGSKDGSQTVCQVAHLGIDFMNDVPNNCDTWKDGIARETELYLISEIKLTWRKPQPSLCLCEDITAGAE